MSYQSALQQISIIGAGAWGTALATVAHRAGRDVTLWAREAEVIASIQQFHQNEMFLDGVSLSSEILATGDFSHLADAHAVLVVTPAQHVRATLGAVASHVSGATPLVLCSKGIEQDSGKRMSAVLQEVLPQAPCAVLSGPSFARDVANGLPTAVTLACDDAVLGRLLAEAIGSPTFRVYQSDDVTGVELGGAVKNVYAIASGIVDGCRLGESARAALIARAFAELTRLAVALGAKAETLTGLSGLGDLILTCTSRQSRNMSLGAALGEGKSLDEILTSRTSVAEGVHTAQAVLELARRNDIEMPIVEAVDAILSGALSVGEAIDRLLRRPVGDET